MIIAFQIANDKYAYKSHSYLLKLFKTFIKKLKNDS